MNGSEQNSHEVTGILHEWNGGNREALDKLMPFVYDELHRQATIFCAANAQTTRSKRPR
jgi:hypothetical protein